MKIWVVMGRPAKYYDSAPWLVCGCMSKVDAYSLAEKAYKRGEELDALGCPKCGKTPFYEYGDGSCSCDSSEVKNEYDPLWESRCRYYVEELKVFEGQS
jgi:hypothetical protein